MRTILLGLILVAAAFGQAGTPDCQFTGTITSTSSNIPVATPFAFNNKTARCTSWRFTYYTNGASAVSVTLGGAPDVAGSPGAFVALTATQGTVNPAVGTAEGTVAAAPDYYPWIRVNAGTFTGTAQQMFVAVYGWKAPDTGPTSTSGGGATGNVNVVQWGSTNTTLGQKAMAASVPTVIASDQSNVPVSQATASALNATVVQPTAASLNATVVQPTAANLNATVVQATAANLNAQAVGAVASGGSNAGNPLKVGGPFNTTQPTVTNGQIVDSQFSARGSLLVTPGVEGFPITPDGGATAVTTNSALTCVLQSAASTNATNCKASSGNFYGLRAVNTTATLYYLRMYNSSGTPTCSSATGFIESIPIPASTTGAGISAVTAIPTGYSTGIAFCFTGGGSSTDNTNAATGVFLTLYYK